MSYSRYLKDQHVDDGDDSYENSMLTTATGCISCFHLFVATNGLTSHERNDIYHTHFLSNQVCVKVILQYRLPDPFIFADIICV